MFKLLLNNNNNINNKFIKKKKNYNNIIRLLNTFSDDQHLLSLNPLTTEKTLDRRTKIVCSIGPKTSSKDEIKKLLLSGMNVARMNASHGSHENFLKIANNIRNAVDELHDQVIDFTDGSLEDICGIALDTKGPEVRSGCFDLTICKDSMNETEEILINRNDIITFSTDIKYKDNQTLNTIYVDYNDLCNCIEKDDVMYVDDGLLKFQTIEVNKNKNEIKTVALNNGYLGSKKGINLPGIKGVDLPAVTEQDVKDLTFAKENNFDFVFASFIRKAKHVKQIREIVGDKVQIISKIENSEGLINIDEIIDESDGIMVARGDLGIEIPLERVFLAQKSIVLKCKLKGKPVICATQMLESMVYHNRPTRAECSDVSNAVLDGCDAVMLSGETAKGLYPNECVQVMSDICRITEKLIDYQSLITKMRREAVKSNKTSEALVSSAVIAALQEDAKLIICMTQKGTTAKLAAKYRPHVPLICLTSNPATARSLTLVRGTQPILYNKSLPLNLAVAIGIRKAFNLGLCNLGDRVVVCLSSNNTGDADTINLINVEDWHCEKIENAVPRTSSI